MGIVRRRIRSNSLFFPCFWLSSETGSRQTASTTTLSLVFGDVSGNVGKPATFPRVGGLVRATVRWRDGEFVRKLPSVSGGGFWGPDGGGMYRPSHGPCRTTTPSDGLLRRDERRSWAGSGFALQAARLTGLGPETPMHPASTDVCIS